MVNFSDKELFEILKKKIETRFFESNSASSPDISDWKGQDIVTFQEDLLTKTKSTVSEKWFYTYFKSEIKKLPRIDMLNILCEYTGYISWTEFVSEQSKNNKTPPEEIRKVVKTVSAPEIIQEETETESEPHKQVPKPLKRRKYIIIFSLIGLLLLGAGVGAYFMFLYKKTYEFCFVDADRKSNVSEPVEVLIAREGFSPLELYTDNGCIEFPSNEDTILMTVKSTYYKQDTFKIDLRLYQGKENIRLQPDDYKVMLRHYSKSSQSVKERIRMLDEMIADNALIYQVFDSEYFGVEVLNKKQYINLVSLPTTSLKNFVLIEAEREHGKIVKIKFKIQSDES